MGKKKSRARRVAEKREVGRDGSALGKSDAAALIETLQRDGITRAKIGGFDLDGVLRGKYVSLDKLRSALVGGFGFCDVIFGWDIERRALRQRPG